MKIDAVSGTNPADYLLWFVTPMNTPDLIQSVSRANNVNRPAFQWQANDFWTQGVTFGLRLQY